MEDYEKINPKLRDQFESLPIDLKNKVLDAGVVIDSMEALTETVEQVLNHNITPKTE